MGWRFPQTSGLRTSRRAVCRVPSTLAMCNMEYSGYWWWQDPQSCIVCGAFCFLVLASDRVEVRPWLLRLSAEYLSPRLSLWLLRLSAEYLCDSLLSTSLPRLPLPYLSVSEEICKWPEQGQWKSCPGLNP